MALERLTRADPLQLGRFTILARIGGGGMGVVYLAEDDEGHAAAVKVVKAELASEDTFRARFRREVDAARRVSGGCTARFLDADTFAPSPWLATEYVAGPTLHHEVYAHGPFVGARLIGLAAGLADALESIHAAGLVHRDFKPANIILAADAPKVIDFGVTMANDSTILTGTGSLVGSPAYMSPEQARGTSFEVGPAADVFSWASCIVFAATGAPPFGEGEAAAVLYRVVHDEPDLTNVDPTVLPFVAAALDKDPARRPTPAALLSGLAAVAQGAPAAAVASPTTGFAPPPAPSAAGVLAATWHPPFTVVPPAEATLLEARELRAVVPQREADRRRQERRRANRAIFVSSVIAITALLVVAVVIVRSSGTNEVALSQAKERDDVPVAPTAPADAVTTTVLGAPPPSIMPVTPGPGGSEAPPTQPGYAPPSTPSTAPSPGVTSSPTVKSPSPTSPPGTGPAPVCSVSVNPASPQWGAQYSVTLTMPQATAITVQAVRRGGPWAGSTVWTFSSSSTTSRAYVLKYKKGVGPAPAPSTTDDVEPHGQTVDVVARRDQGGTTACTTSYTTPAQAPG